jgi:hypothetical protein
MPGEVTVWNGSDILEQPKRIKNYTQKEINSRFKSGNTCYHFMQSVLSSSLLLSNIKVKIYRDIILSVLYGCEIWSLTMREERRLRAFENRVLRRMFGPKKDEVTLEWRNLHNEGLIDRYFSPNIRVIKWRKVRWVGHVVLMGERKGAYWVLVGKPVGRRPLGRPRLRWEDNIKMDVPRSGMWGHGLN